MHLNTLRSKQNGWLFVDTISKCILYKGKFLILIKDSSWGPNWLWINIGSCTGFTSNWWQAITWTSSTHICFYLCFLMRISRTCLNEIWMNIFQSWDTIEEVIFKIADILFRPQWVKFAASLVGMVFIITISLHAYMKYGDRRPSMRIGKVSVIPQHSFMVSMSSCAPTLVVASGTI